MLSVKQGDIKYHFLSLWLNPDLSGYWPTLYPWDQWLEDKGVVTFPTVIWPKWKIKARPELELSYYDIKAQDVSQYLFEVTVTWVQVFNEADCISLRANALRKDLNTTILAPAMCKYWNWQGNLSIIRQPV